MAKILVVDDSEVIRVQLRNELSGAGHDIVEAHDGLNGLEVLGQNKDTDLIICDVNMPEMDGLTMCGEIHQNVALNEIPIIMLTTQSSPELKEKGKKNGVVAWITKPHKPSVLVAGVEKILERATSA